MAGDSESIGIVHPLRPRDSQGLVTSSLPYFQPSPRISSFRPFFTPARSSRSVSQGGWDGRWAEKRDRGGVSGTTPAINTVMTLASSPSPPLAIRDVTMLSVSLFYAIANMPESSSPLWTRFIRLYRAISSPFAAPSFPCQSEWRLILLLLLLLSRWKRNDLINSSSRFELNLVKSNEGWWSILEE